MAGYIFNIGEADVFEIIKKGYYATYIYWDKKIASTPFEGTFADYVTMNTGDNVYFFQKRKIFGIGKLVKIGDDCKYNNFNQASVEKTFSYANIKDSLLVDFGKESAHYRWICFFEQAPCFFDEGLDMDEVLVYKPDTFKALRTNWKKTFVKLDDEENQSLRELFFLRLYNSSSTFAASLDKQKVLAKLKPCQRLNSKELLSECIKGDKIAHEMAIEAATLEKIFLASSEIFGRWDFLSHQVQASPFKPVDYMDRMDIFAYKYTEVDSCKVISKYMVIELKKDSADLETIAQITNYVDWLCKKYTYGDYSMIEAYILAKDFKPEMYNQEEQYERTYNIGAHPIKVKKWKDLRFVKYEVEDGDLKYIDVTNLVKII